MARRGGSGQGGGDKAVTLRGYDPIRRELRKLDDPKAIVGELKGFFFEVAEHVSDAAVGIASREGRQQAAAARDLAPRRRQKGAVIGIGAKGRSKQWAVGAEFGSLAYPQFPAWRGNQWNFRGLSYSDHETGYFLHPAIRQETDWVIDKADRELGRIFSKAFPD